MTQTTVDLGSFSVDSHGWGTYNWILLRDGSGEPVTLVLNGSGRDVRTVIVDGRTVVEDRALEGVSLTDFHERAQRQYEKLIASYPERAHLHPPVEEIFAPSFPIRRGS